MEGHYPCEQALATAAFTVQKSATVVMGSPLTLCVMRQQKCTTAAQQISPIPVGQQVYIRNFVRRWKDSKFEEPYPVIQSTPTAVKVEGRKPWIHLSDIRLAPALCQTSPLVQEHLEENEQKEKQH
ncbi:hypothetical protein NDU88_000606 [Pleurodeles waltl]|uniref:Murine leukemia virus integrase C-terminal domain-containing protein n=1 Tax=Pleurodeles waltl TaxID=8319 RepID=A0AAV7SX59_PLEWA|nr:hypothetical protein NDU88_000606 [Pleurodeles waltl]